jgi:amidase
VTNNTSSNPHILLILLLLSLLLSFIFFNPQLLSPAWRNILQLSALPWLQDHLLHKDVVFPAAGFIAIVGEAIRQISGAEDYTVQKVTEVFFEEAIERAKQLDEERRLNPDRPLKPLHGLPISLKDSFKLKGKDSSIGIAALVGKPAKTSSPLVDILISLGAIPYCKTNVGQLMLSNDTDNNVFGRTLNPHNTSLTTGGSSGGEVALIALRGSVLGVGTDFGGSIRGPCSATGVYGFKPSAGLIPYAGQQSPSAPSVPLIMPSAGPIATSLRACQFFVESVMKTEPWRRDISCLRIPWTGYSSPRRQLRVGILMDDSAFTPTPPLRRAMDEYDGPLSFHQI